MGKTITFKAKGYLETAKLDKYGGKHISFEFSAGDAVESAKLELMGRDLKNFLPVLLEITVRIADGKKGWKEEKSKSRKNGKAKQKRIDLTRKG